MASVEFQWLFATEYPAVLRTVWLVLRDRARAEDIAQDAFEQLLLHWEKVRNYDSPETWVRRVALRRAAQWVRREHRLTPRLRLAAQPEIAGEPELPDPGLLAAVRDLPMRQRAAVVLFYFEDRPMTEIAQILDCSPATGWVHLHRARRRLAEQLGEEMVSDVT